MQEYVTDAIVLAKRPSGELDARYTLFTKKFGKMIARAKSSRKITSKLAGHLEPGSILKVRFIEKAGVQIVDALKIAKTEISIADLMSLADVIPEMDVDATLWEAVVDHPWSWSDIVRILGWDPKGATCAGCGAKDIAYFFTPHQEFFCSRCVSKSASHEVSFIRINEVANNER